jgi:phenylpropionate dioxygenase-like ring-hydroxylating dioxygenase large terminal subunit
MLKNLWYVVARADGLGTHPIKATVIGQDFAVFRDNAGKPVVLSDICIHRGGSLSGGLVTGAGHIECPYHGWQFGADGVCARIPAQPDSAIPAKARVDSYPAVERYGWIWAFLGDLAEAERPPLPDLSWTEDPAFRLVYGHYDWDVNWQRVAENGLDFAHTPFVHGTSFGDRDRPQMDDFTVDRSDWGGSAKMTMRAPPARTGLFAWRRSKDRIPVTTTPGYHLSGPCVTLYLRPRADWAINIASAHVPLDEHRTRTWWVMGRNFLKSRLFDRRTYRRNIVVFDQDNAVLRNVRPRRTPDGWTQEVTVKSDALQVAFRRTVIALEDKGWRIDSDRIAREFADKKSCAIPCPTRRETDGWVFDSVPFVAPGAPTD